MPKRKDLKTILVVGAGPIIIGQACEFDYSGTQACKALKDEGYKVVLINSNPATIMTDPGVAHKTYIEPITIEVLEKILIKEKISSIEGLKELILDENIAAEIREKLKEQEEKRTSIQATLDLILKSISERIQKSLMIFKTKYRNQTSLDNLLNGIEKTIKYYE